MIQSVPTYARAPSGSATTSVGSGSSISCAGTATTAAMTAPAKIGGAAATMIFRNPVPSRRDAKSDVDDREQGGDGGLAGGHGDDPLFDEDDDAGDHERRSRDRELDQDV